MPCANAEFFHMASLTRNDEILKLVCSRESDGHRHGVVFTWDFMSTFLPCEFSLRTPSASQYRAVRIITLVSRSIASFVFHVENSNPGRANLFALDATSSIQGGAERHARAPRRFGTKSAGQITGCRAIGNSAACQASGCEWIRDLDQSSRSEPVDEAYRQASETQGGVPAPTGSFDVFRGSSARIPSS